jgi:hypothetical protein
MEVIPFQAEIENARATAESKEEEAARLQEEIENAKRQLMVKYRNTVSNLTFYAL